MRIRLALTLLTVSSALLYAFGSNAQGTPQVTPAAPLPIRITPPVGAYAARGQPALVGVRSLQQVTTGAEPKHTPVVSPRGDMLLYSTAQGIHAMSLTAPAADSMIAANAGHPTWLRDGSGFLYVVTGETMMLLRLRDRAHPITVVNYSNRHIAQPIDISPSGQWATYGRFDGRNALSFINTRDGIEHLIPDMSSARWARDGNHFLITAQDGKFAVVDPNAIERLAFTTFKGAYGDLSPDGTHIVFVSQAPGYCAPRRGSGPQPIMRGETTVVIGRISDNATYPLLRIGVYGSVQDFFWASDGYIYFAWDYFNETQIWRMRPGALPITPLTHEDATPFRI